MRALPSPLLVVTDRLTANRPLVATVAALLEGGARWVWFRERDMDAASRRTLAIAVMARVQAHGGTFTMGGDPNLAAAIGADGVHLPGDATGDDIKRARDLLADGLVGVSAHSVREVETAAGAGADYATLSPIFSTASKPGYGPALGTASISLAAELGLPVIALGGITPANTAACREADAAGIAVMGGLMRPLVSAEAAAGFLGAWTRGSREKPVLRSIGRRPEGLHRETKH